LTFVLSAITHDEILQVSDRRFTFVNPDGSIHRRDDESNKMVLFCGRIMFGFTGRGDLGMERQTDLWLANRIGEVNATLGEPSQVGMLSGIAKKLTDLFKKRRYAGQRHAFVAAAWARMQPAPPSRPATPNEMSPYLAYISNFHDADGNELDAVNAAFQVFMRPLAHQEPVAVLGAPAHLSSGEVRALEQDLAAAAAQDDREALIGILGSKIREVAARDENVGEGLMISVFPRASIGDRDGFYIAGAPEPNLRSFLYVPPSNDVSVQLGPVVTCGQGIASGFEARSL
jgi:hypothetical protein